jgi:hypothetical protein
MINTRTTDYGRHVSLDQLIPNRFSQHCSERRVDDPHRVRAIPTSVRSARKRRTRAGVRDPQPNRAETRPDMHPHGVRVVGPRRRPKPCPRHGFQRVISVGAHRPRPPPLGFPPPSWTSATSSGLNSNRSMIILLSARGGVSASAELECLGGFGRLIKGTGTNGASHLSHRRQGSGRNSDQAEGPAMRSGCLQPLPCHRQPPCLVDRT